VNKLSNTHCFYTSAFCVPETVLIDYQTTQCCIQVDYSASALSSNDQTASSLANPVS